MHGLEIMSATIENPLPNTHELTSLLSQMESLGDNCELGFVLRKHHQNGGSLFRWSITTANTLVAFLNQPKLDIYQLGCLTPYSPKMAKDASCGFCFHSTMLSSKIDGILQFDLLESDRRAIHAIEKEKFKHLQGKFNDRLSLGGIFVCKQNEELPDEIRH